MDEHLDILRHELEADDGSFLIKILIKMRIELEWDQNAFSRATEAMHIYCDQHTGSDSVERWVASGFYYFSWAVKDWTTHPNFPKPHPQEYYESAYQRLFDLCCYLFDGISPYEAGAWPEQL